MSYLHIDEFSAEHFTDFDGSQVVVSESFVMFWKPPNTFGQWTLSPFEIDGIKYNCAEQYMMSEKARLFNDASVERAILATPSPREQQKLGKRVSGFVNDVWEKERCEIVFRGNIAKFSQNADLLKQLLETEERSMVEASPIDRIWGIGLAADDERAYDPIRWRGQNLLGNVLTRVRAHLRQN
jgi:ribA/ribD-fused uncharacterized protein